jgi:hypothetical protein
MEYKKIFDKRSPYKYIVIIRNGVDWRLFKDLDLMCELMGLDPDIAKKHFEKKGFMVGYEFTVFRVQEETDTKHRGYYK